MTRKIAGYIRITKREEDNNEANVSLSTQRSRVSNFYKDVDIFKIYDADANKTAFVKDDKIDIEIVGNQMIATFDLTARPGLREMLEDAKKANFQEIVITRYDRISRSAVLQRLILYFLQKLGIELTPTDDSKDILVREITGVLNEEEPRRVSKRLNLTLKRKFDEGIIIGKMPFGYKWNKKKKEVEINEREANLVKQAFEMTIKGERYDTICKQLKIPIATYYNLIKNKVYTGKVVLKNEVKEGKHQALISEDLFKQANEAIVGQKKSDI